MTRTAILAACRALPEGDGDDHAVPRALADLGFETSWAVWDDRSVDFAAADIVVPKATWDYAERREEFLAWCESVPSLANAVGVVRWSIDKRYLAELAAAGVATVPTELVEPGGTARWPSGELVIKPSVGNGSRGAVRFRTGAHAEAAEHLASLHEAGHTAMVQPYQSSVDADGETALVFFGGVYSHAFTKGAMLNGSDMDGSGLFVSERLGIAEPGAPLRALAEDTLDAIAALLGIARAELLYARIDVIGGNDGIPMVLEAELVEPSLGFRYADVGAPLRFASAVRRHLG